MGNSRKRVGAVIVAAGSSRRMNGADKIFTELGGRPVLCRTIDAFEQCGAVDEIVLVLASGNLEKGKTLAAGEGWKKLKEICPGGERRQDSVTAGLARLDGCEWVVVHDGARPLVTGELIESGLEAAEETGAAIAAVPVTDTIKIAGDDLTIKGTPVRENLWAAQTPQVFRLELLQKAYEGLDADVTDDAAVAEKSGVAVKLYPGSVENIKITRPQDIAVAELYLKSRKS